MRICFFGTPEFAVPSLKMLHDEGYEIAGVFTQPDRPQGRRSKLIAPPVKELALELGIPVYQYQKISREGLDTLKALNPDVCVSAAFGQIFSKQILDVPPLGMINVHASLLPKYRGSAPINWAIIEGEKKTGITTMYTIEQVDAGDMILKREIDIKPYETAGELTLRLAELGQQTLKETMRLIKEGKAPRQKQQENEATYYPMLTRQTGLIDWTRSRQSIIDLIRGTDPWPGAFTEHEGCCVKIWKACFADADGGYQPGQVICSDGRNGLIVAAGDGPLYIDTMQLPGCRKMDSKAAMCGNPFGDVVLGE